MVKVQRNLQLHIEEQGKQLKQMLDQQLKSSNTLADTHTLDNSKNRDQKDACDFNVEGFKDPHSISMYCTR